MSQINSFRARACFAYGRPRAAEFADIEARLSQPEDPLFGAPGEERFAALRQDILHWAQEARAQEARLGQKTRGQKTHGQYTIY